MEELLAVAEALAAAGEAARQAAEAAPPPLRGASVAAAGGTPAATGGIMEWAKSIAGQAAGPLLPVSRLESAAGWAAKAAGGSSGSVADGLLRSVLSPLFRLFSFGGGGGEEGSETVSLPRYIRPAREVQSLSIQAEDGWGFRGSDYDGTGRARAIPQTAPQVVVQVNAIDSRSFVDHSQEIADAVRRAVLESNSLGDLFREMEG
jgi:hypothetical protein